ncbi:hypothetical protein ANN_07524 [Periplaneta americana]|uniref:Uncharacterized protein n=1 Tax=Periplaneta americana TaxID=6978 RepID=A0ABQ8T0G8_PERAM|nr:hypothetical protein ANN_07524 [Periplaneta americana]
MAGLCEGGNEPPGSLKANNQATKGNIEGGGFGPVMRIEFGVAQWSERLPPRDSNTLPAREQVARESTRAPQSTGVRTRVRQGARQTKRWYGEHLHAEGQRGCITSTRRGEVARAAATCGVKGGRTLPNRPGESVEVEISR